MYISIKKIKQTTPEISDGIELVKVEYEDGKIEILSKLMYDVVVSETSYDATTLREKRITPVVAEMLKVLRNWGIKINELPYMSIVLNTSLDSNAKQATKELWLPWNSLIQDVDDVDLITIDRVLKAKKQKELLSPYYDKPEQK